MQRIGSWSWKPGTWMKCNRGVRALGLISGIAFMATVVTTGCGGGVEATKAGQAKTRLSETVAPAPATTVGQTASGDAQGAKFFIYAETLTADRPSVYGFIAPRGCTPSGVFKRGERIVWRFEILDVATGKIVTSAEAASVKLRLPYGVEPPADFKQRGEGRVPDAPWTWDVCWDVPLDYPMGVLDYTILITLKDGRTGTWKPPALVDPGRGIDTRPQVIE
ncbi:MAG: hypothetical protein Q8P00_02465 [Dehalococcoidia bacterium]|nr:hypothetical protein [Dehalococcoidia bacterium]